MDSLESLLARCIAGTAAESEQREAERLRAWAERKPTERRERLLAMFRSSWVTSSEAALDAIISRKLKSTQARRSVGAFMDHKQVRFLILCGGVGSGKTIAAIEALYARYAPTLDCALDEYQGREDSDYHHGAFRRAIRVAPGLLVPAGKLPQTFEPWSDERERHGDGFGYTDPPILVVDDLGTERETQRFQEVFAALVDARQHESCKTIITTNLAKRDLRGRYGDRVADRLNHTGVAVELKGASMRRNGAGL